MTDALVPLAPAASDLAARWSDWWRVAQGAYAPATLGAVHADLRLWAHWCRSAGVAPLPASGADVAAFLLAMEEGRSVGYLRRMLAAISVAHRAVGLPSPTTSEAVRLCIRGIARARATAGVGRPRQARGLSAVDVRVMLATAAPAGTRPLKQQRDLALVMLARDAMLRRSEIAALRLVDVTRNPDGFAVVAVRRSKTDQLGEGRTLWVSAPTMVEVDAWVQRAGLVDGFLFRSLRRGGHPTSQPMPGPSVAAAFKAMASQIGIDPSAVSGHSGRVGMAQDLVADGAGLAEVMTAGRWSSATMVARYAENTLAGRGAVSRFYARQGVQEAR